MSHISEFIARNLALFPVIKVAILTFVSQLYTWDGDCKKKSQNSEIISHHNEQQSQDIKSELLD